MEHGSGTIETFEIHIADDELADLGRRLDLARFPDELDGAGWDYGIPLGHTRDLIATWRESFDWRAREGELNRLDHCTTVIDGLRLHFVHQRSREAGARPLVMLHGWPGSFYEFHKVVGPLTDPVAHGGRAEDAFHVVCPSLPGYGFSEAPRTRGFGARRIAAAVAVLMARLGYDRYLAQGGDFGFHVARFLGLDDPACRSIHINLVVAFPPPGVEDPTAGLTAGEKRDLAEVERFRNQEMGYFHLQTTKPQTLGYALTDSPVGLAAWMAEKFRSPDFGAGEDRVSRDELLTLISIYWFTGSITSSMRLYKEALRPGELLPPWSRVEVPTACLIAPREVSRPPRRWAEELYNVTRWTRLERGGHFLALEEPEALVGDLRAWARSAE